MSREIIAECRTHGIRPLRVLRTDVGGILLYFTRDDRKVSFELAEHEESRVRFQHGDLPPQTQPIDAETIQFAARFLANEPSHLSREEWIAFVDRGVRSRNAW
ncbi:MAG: hypothetical protein BGO01_13525 [Armatimonadetes bacterium 55-13]|nr:hypothetical protein [Armatimonadota bacterium]OJU64748.1 MAG: hypothetical protein BGO01_13525 [Armatimonadetes bacterium 55-13]